MNKKAIIVSAIIGIATFFQAVGVKPVFAQEDDDGKRQTYSLQQVDEGILGDTVTFNSIKVTDTDAAWYKAHYGKDLPVGMLKNETNFVGAREDTGINAGEKNLWSDNITVEDGKTYIVRIYVHNNNPNGESGAAEDTSVHFFVPTLSDNSITVDGWITSSNAQPREYVDDVVFNSDIPFHLEYQEGSAILENNGIGADGGCKLSDSVIDQYTQIGYNALDGHIPGCYQYNNYASIEVKAVFDYEFATETQVRLADSDDKTWQKTIEAKVGDKVEFQMEYHNTSSLRQTGTAVRYVLPPNLHYISGSSKLINASNPTGTVFDGDSIIANGVRIGNYGPGANAYILIEAEVVDDNLAEGSNTLVNWGQAGVGNTVIQDYARVEVYKDTKFEIFSNIWLSIIIITFVIIIILLCLIQILKYFINKYNHKK